MRIVQSMEFPSVTEHSVFIKMGNQLIQCKSGRYSNLKIKMPRKIQTHCMAKKLLFEQYGKLLPGFRLKLLQIFFISVLR